MDISLAASAAPTPALPAAPLTAPEPAAPEPAAVVTLSVEARAAIQAPARAEPPVEMGSLLLDTNLDGTLEALPHLKPRAPKPLAVVA